MKPPILTPSRSQDGQYRISRSTPVGRSEPYPEPIFPHKVIADWFCRDRNEANGRNRDEVVLARLRGVEIADAEIILPVSE